MQVLEGWLFLGNVQELGSRLTNAYMSAVSASCAQTVRSVLLTQPALAARALSGATMHDLTHGVPSDLFRTCLARVCPPSEQHLSFGTSVRVQRCLTGLLYIAPHHITGRGMGMLTR